jgi:maleylacetoacetate isomerase
MGRIELYSYWRSSAAYRVRIGLNLKGLPHQITPVHLVRDGGQQHTAAYAALNPQELVPTLRHGERVLQQSMAILEYLDEVFPDPALLPDDAEGRARVRALAQLVACDIHPLNNLRVMQFFSDTWSVPQPERDDWTRHWIRVGFDAMERMLVESVDTGRF